MGFSGSPCSSPGQLSCLQVPRSQPLLPQPSDRQRPGLYQPSTKPALGSAAVLFHSACELTQSKVEDGALSAAEMEMLGCPPTRHVPHDLRERRDFTPPNAFSHILHPDTSLDWNGGARRWDRPAFEADRLLRKNTLNPASPAQMQIQALPSQRLPTQLGPCAPLACGRSPVCLPA